MIIDGRKIAKNLEQGLKQKLEMEPKKSVAFVLFGNDPASLQFIGIKSRVAERIGIETKTFHFPDINLTDEALQNINEINKQEYDGIIVQLPLPTGIDTDIVLNSVPVEKDIDVLGDDAKKMYQSGTSKNIPPVAAAVWELLTSTDVDLKEKKILIVGNGKLVGEPVAMMFSREQIQYSVVDKNTDINERDEKLKNADVIISGVGIAHMIKPEMIKEGVVLIDAGTSESNGELVGDIDPECAKIASFITLVPGGVGPVTVVSLFNNLLK